MIFRFILYSPVELVKRDTLILSFDEGGLNMFKIEAKIKTISLHNFLYFLKSYERDCFKMSFYITLPSNSNINEFPNNKQNNYTTLFKQPIILENPYEVALTEISHSSMFSAELGQLQFPNPFDDFDFRNT